MQGRKKTVLTAALIILVVLLGLTIVSRSVHTMLLPGVRRVNIRTDRLTYHHSFTGVIGPGSGQDGHTLHLTLSLDEMEAATGASGLSCTVAEGKKETVYKLQLESFDTQNGGQSYEVIYRLDTGDTLAPGTPATVSFTTQSEELTLVPLGNVFLDDYGNSVIYALHERSGIWGLAYYVEAVQVTELGSDHQYTAIELTAGESVIAAYPTKPLADGMEVQVNL